MRCTDAQKLSSSYLDSELSPERSAAVRGHLRTCQDCNARFESERELIDAAGELSPLDPPDSIWDAVQARIAEEEVKDSQEWPLRRWFRFHWRPVAGMGLAAVMASTLWIARAQTKAAESSHTESAALATPGPLAEKYEHSYEETRIADLAEADQHYIETIASLREMLEEDRPQWNADDAALIDENLAAFATAGGGTRLAVGSMASNERDSLYAGYRSEIDYLQSALAGDFSGGRR